MSSQIVIPTRVPATSTIVTPSPGAKYRFSSKTP